jgi:hypothetical protein
MLIEYCGRPDDPGYAAGMAKKQAVYRANGLTALLPMPARLRDDWPTRILDEIEAVMAGRLTSIRSIRALRSGPEDS